MYPIGGGDDEAHKAFPSLRTVLFPSSTHCPIPTISEYEEFYIFGI
jgi:hypothetical protein